MSEPSPLQSAIAGYQAAVMVAFSAYAVALAEYEAATGERLPRLPFTVPTLPGMAQTFGAFNQSCDSPAAMATSIALDSAIDAARQ